MKRTTSTLSFLTLLLILSLGISFSQEVDLTGTWEGTTEVPDLPEPDKITLVLEKTDEGYTGTASDSSGMLENVEIEDIEFKEGKLSFNFTFFDGDQYTTVYLYLTLEGNKMSGYWEVEDGTSASIELEKIK